MSAVLGEYDWNHPSALMTYTICGKTHQSAGSTSDKNYDFVDFLGAAQILKIDFLPITWQPALDKVGEGGTAEIRQALVNIQTTFAFKHLKHPRSSMEEARNLRALTAEISILGHPTVRAHPNIASIEGICWDVVFGGEKVWPVLVFEKTKSGDLGSFMTTGIGRHLHFKERLDMLYDIALAVRDLHTIGIIHGDIKPENVLVFSENGSHYRAKVIDFGYSTMFTTDSNPITMPKSGLWTAPEQHHREVLPIQARKIDAYSIGMLSLWILFYNNGTNQGGKLEEDLECSHKEALDHAFQLIEASTDLEFRDEDKIRKFFNLTLAQNPSKRVSDFNELLLFLSSSRAVGSTPSVDKIAVPHNDFEIARSVGRLVQAHYGVRYYIAKCLEERRKQAAATRRHNLNLALCYELGFGVCRDIIKCSRILLSTHDVSVEILNFHDGIFKRSVQRGHFNAFDFSLQYRKEQQSYEAESRYQREVETLGDLLGNDHCLVQESRRQLSLLLYSQGRWQDAEKLQVQMIELGHGVTIDGRYRGRYTLYLAATYIQQERWKEAEELHIQVIQTHKSELGMDHPGILTSIANLAMVYARQGFWKEAEELEIQVLETSKRILGTDHPDTISSMANLAMTYCSQGLWKKGEELELQAIAISEKVLGAEHPDTLSTIATLAWTYRNQGQHKQAQDLIRHVMEMRKMVLGMEHPDTLASMTNLAFTYWEQGQWKDVGDLETQVMKASIKVLGFEHPDTLARIANLASTWEKLGHWDEAEPMLLEVIEAYKRILGAEHPETLRAIANLASAYCSEGRQREAEKLEVHVIETSKRVLGNEHPHTLATMSNLAMTYRHQKRLDEAEKLEWQIVELRKISVRHAEALPRTLSGKRKVL